MHPSGAVEPLGPGAHGEMDDPGRASGRNSAPRCRRRSRRRARRGFSSLPADAAAGLGGLGLLRRSASRPTRACAILLLGEPSWAEVLGSARTTWDFFPSLPRSGPPGSPRWAAGRRDDPALPASAPWLSSLSGTISWEPGFGWSRKVLLGDGTPVEEPWSFATWHRCRLHGQDGAVRVAPRPRWPGQPLHS